MTIREVTSSSEFESEIKKKALTVVKYFANWCGPCKQIAPFVEGLTRKYPHVNFIQVDADKSSISQERNVSALPTFQFYIAGNMVDEMKGANPVELENKVVQRQVQPVNAFAGKGFSLASADTGASADGQALAGRGQDPGSLREARLKAFASASSASSSAPTTAPTPSALATTNAASNGDFVETEEDDDLARALALSVQETLKPSLAPFKAESTAVNTVTATITAAEQDKLDHAEAEAEQRREEQEWGDEMVPVPVPLDLLNEMLEMGFTEVRARKGLYHGKTVEGATQWIADNEGDENIDQPYMVKKSDVEPKPVLSEEQRAAKVAEMKAKIQKRKDDRIREERDAEIRREKERRERGKNTTEIQEERDRLMRKREAEKQKREKQEAEREKQRLLAEIARDKELRKLNKGVLPSVLGVDGYNPSSGGDVPISTPAMTAPSTGAKAVSVAVDTKSIPSVATVKSSVIGAGVKPLSELTREEKEQRIEAAIETIMKYRTAGDGGHALKLLVTFAKNIRDQPSEQKYAKSPHEHFLFRQINTDGAAYKTKIAPLTGPKTILTLLGFKRAVDDESKLRLDGDPDTLLFASVTDKLTHAETLYRQLNS